MLQRHRHHLDLGAGEHAPAVDARAIARVVVAEDVAGRQHAAAQTEIHRRHVLLAHQVVVETDRPDQAAAAVRHHQPHGGRAAIHHLLEHPQKAQQQLLDALGLVDAGGHVVEDLERGGLLGEPAGLARDPVVHVLVKLGQLFVQAADVLGDAPKHAGLQQGVAGARLALTDAC